MKKFSTNSKCILFDLCVIDKISEAAVMLCIFVAASAERLVFDKSLFDKYTYLKGGMITFQ